jgi:hypothetical protein
MNGIVKVIKLVNADRIAGMGILDKPDPSLVGSMGIITRPLINTDGFWVELLLKDRLLGVKRFKTVFLREELAKATPEEQKKYQELKDELESRKVAERL